MAGVVTKYSSFVPKIINTASGTIVPLKKAKYLETRKLAMMYVHLFH